MNRLLLLFVALSVCSGTHAEVTEACEVAEARQFDFFLGDWTIEQRIRTQDGGWLALDAETSVRRAVGGCALVENWRGDVEFFWAGMTAPVNMHGLSVRAWNPDTRQWNIYWMDTMSPHFDGGFSGAFADGRGEFFREFEGPEGKRVMRITFANITDTSFDWELAVSRDDRETWRSMWTMQISRTAVKRFP